LPARPPEPPGKPPAGLLTGPPAEPPKPPVEPPAEPPEPKGYLGPTFWGKVTREAEKIYQDYVNRLASIQNITKKAKKLGMEIKPGEDPGLRASTYLSISRKVESVLEDKTYRILPTGELEITGEGLKPILDDFDAAAKSFEPSRKRREKDFKDFLIARRAVLDLQYKRPGAKRAVVTPEQAEVYKAQLAALNKKYGPQGIIALQKSAERLYEYQKRVFHLLVDSGIITEGRYQDIVNRHKHYIPFDRILDEELKAGVPVSKGRFTGARAPFQAIKGSDLDIHDPIESVIKNTYRIMDRAERNIVARSLAKFTQIFPDDVSPVRVKMIPIKVSPKEIATRLKTFRKQAREVIQEAEKAPDVKGPAKKLEAVVREALTQRGFTEAEARSFIEQIRKQSDKPQTSQLRDIVKETERIMILQEPAETTIFRPSQFKPKGRVIEYFENGKRRFIELSPNLYDAMTGLDEVRATLLVRIFSSPAHWLRVGATSTPEFMVRNVIRDQFIAAMQTNFGFVPFVDSMGAVADVLGKTDVYYDFLRSGGAYAGFVELNRPALKKAIKRLTEPSSRKLLKRLNILTTAQDASQVLEMATRLGVYKAAVRAGKTPVEAAFESRENPADFMRRGAKTANINRLTAFFNANVQGADKSIRTAIKRPFSTALKGLIYITIPSLLLYLRNRKDPEYAEIPRWQKDLFWVFKAGGFWWRIPKPFVYGQVFGSIPERFFEYLDTKDPAALDGVAKSVYDSVSPAYGDPESGLLISAVRPLIENWGNRSFFLQRPIVPRYVEDLEPPYQYGRYTTESAKQLGEWLNYSPAKIENLVRGYFGGSGRYALEAMDALSNAIKEEATVKPPRTAADIPLIKGFAVRRPTGPQAESIQKFYELSDKILAKERTFKSLLRNEGRERAQAYRAKNPEIVMAGRLNGIRERMANIQKMIDRVIKSDKSDKEKLAEIKALDERRLETAREGLKLLRGKK